MNAFIERLAKRGFEEAIARIPKEFSEGIVWETETEALRNDWRAYVRAILAEAHDAVTEEMLDAAPWQVAIDAALKEEG